MFCFDELCGGAVLVNVPCRGVPCWECLGLPSPTQMVSNSFNLIGLDNCLTYEFDVLVFCRKYFIQYFLDEAQSWAVTFDTVTKSVLHRRPNTP